MYKVYKYTNKVNGKIYIGRTKCSLSERSQANGRNYRECRRFYNDILLYGWENFKPEILEDNIQTREKANEREIYYISKYHSNNIDVGYNIAEGGENAPLIQESKQRISSLAKERYIDPRNNPMYGKKHSEKSLKIMSAKKKGRNNPMYGKHWSDKAKQNLSDKFKGKILRKSEWTQEERDRARLVMKNNSKNWSKRVRCIEDNTEFDTITDAANYYSVSVSTLSGHLHKRQHTCKNKHFEFIN